MENAGISTCANPQCGTEFKRLGEGKLYVRRAEKGDKESTQKALWLCASCVGHFDLRYDRLRREYVLITRRRSA